MSLVGPIVVAKVPKAPNGSSQAINESGAMLCAYDSISRWRCVMCKRLEWIPHSRVLFMRRPVCSTWQHVTMVACRVPSWIAASSASWMNGRTSTPKIAKCHWTRARNVGQFTFFFALTTPYSDSAVFKIPNSCWVRSSPKYSPRILSQLTCAILSFTISPSVLFFNAMLSNLATGAIPM